MRTNKDSFSEVKWRDLSGFVGNGTIMAVPDTSATNQQRFYRVRIE